MAPPNTPVSHTTPLVEKQPAEASSAAVLEARARQSSLRIVEQNATSHGGTSPLMGVGERNHAAGAIALQLRDWLLAQAKVICRNAPDAEDLVQETLTRFMATFGSTSPLPNESTCAKWLVTTLTNIFYDQCRKQRVQARRVNDLSLAAEARTEQPEPPPAYESLTDEQIEEAISMLGSVGRTTFELHAAGKKNPDIARELGIRPGTVAKRLHDARVKLRTILRKYLQAGMN
ncbi:RNA polymerase sigma factor [Pyxidicoccus parkwayensis]|uniref:RNA polymerase sigma factor n=1 Tax=Pyxidicoccus parkwayensis TaxID=2813578 RepID=A0ABX7NW96_9BACT|nr:RNA polymerase sigma factor [Pyxidicoccus parkwaysis]QSQ23216.1 RNA polymerase sigma factor [Pyxidicoccus parkwaysis]